MRRLPLILLSLCLAVFPCRARQGEIGVSDHLHEMLGRYVEAMEDMPAAAKAGECDFIISNCTDTLLRTEVVCWLFDHYRRSALMGDESVAVAVYDKWIDGSSLPFDSSWLASSGLFTEYCRQSLTGLEAPVLTLQDRNGAPLAVPQMSGVCDDVQVFKAQSILYFYDTSCSNCKMQTILLRHLLEDFKDLDINLYAIYTGTDREAWLSYIQEQFVLREGVRVIHAWDPQVLSDYPHKYDVLGTPRMFLVDGGGTITGRRLDPEALKQLLSVADIQRDLVSRAPVGSLMPGLVVPGTLLVMRKTVRRSEGRFSLRQRARQTTVLIYTRGCANCTEALERAEKGLRRRQRALLVDMDEVLATDEEAAGQMFDSFNLAVMPQAFVLDRKGRIVAKTSASAYGQR